MAAPAMPIKPNTTTPDEYYRSHNLTTPREYHVAESRTGIDPHTGEGRFNVLNSLDLMVCWHTTYMAAVACARGVRCSKGHLNTQRGH